MPAADPALGAVTGGLGRRHLVSEQARTASEFAGPMLASRQCFCRMTLWPRL